MTTQLNFSSISFSATIEQDEPMAYVTLAVDGEEAGELQLARTAVQGQWAIDGVKISPSYRGCGFYSQLLANAINMIRGCDSLVSNERNELSNPAYRHWIRDAELSEDTPVVIELSGESLTFSISQ